MQGLSDRVNTCRDRNGDEAGTFAAGQERAAAPHLGRRAAVQSLP